VICRWHISREHSEHGKVVPAALHRSHSSMKSGASGASHKSAESAALPHVGDAAGDAAVLMNAAAAVWAGHGSGGATGVALADAIAIRTMAVLNLAIFLDRSKDHQSEDLLACDGLSDGPLFHIASRLMASFNTPYLGQAFNAAMSDLAARQLTPLTAIAAGDRAPRAADESKVGPLPLSRAAPAGAAPGPRSPPGAVGCDPTPHSFDPDAFIDAVDEDFKCGICFRVPRRATSVSCCGKIRCGARTTRFCTSLTRMDVAAVGSAWCLRSRPSQSAHTAGRRPKTK
jgi:hypothetical protein